MFLINQLSFHQKLLDKKLKLVYSWFSFVYLLRDSLWKATKNWLINLKSFRIGLLFYGPHTGWWTKTNWLASSFALVLTFTIWKLCNVAIRGLHREHQSLLQKILLRNSLEEYNSGYLGLDGSKPRISNAIPILLICKNLSIPKWEIMAYFLCLSNFD